MVLNIYTQADDETMLQVVLDHGQLREARCNPNTNRIQTTPKPTPVVLLRCRPARFRGLPKPRSTVGRLAQLVQSAWFTPRRSQVRILYRPLINGGQWVHE